MEDRQAIDSEMRCHRPNGSVAVIQSGAFTR